MVGRGVSRTMLYSIVVVLFLLLFFPIFAHADSLGDVDRLGKLARNMAALAGGSDYQLDCGPARYVFNTPAADPSPADFSPNGDYYCIMKQGSTIRFGTFMRKTNGPDDGILAQKMLTTLKYGVYMNHSNPVPPRVKIDVCDNYAGESNFISCSDKVSDLYAYVYEDGQDATYVILSSTQVSQFESSFFTDVLDFFNRLFGGTDTTTGFLATPDKFTYGYFANVSGRSVNAEWLDTTATITYANFVTDFSSMIPSSDVEYLVGHGHTQALVFTNMDTQSTLNIFLWRKFTSGLRITAVAGTPVAGGVCGDGKTDFDEQCDPAADSSTWKKSSCKAAGYNGGGNLSCYPASDPVRGCTFDTTACVSCQDGDHDGVPGGQGVSGALRILGPTPFGTSEPYRPISDQAYSQLALRKHSLGIQYEEFPTTYDYEFPKGSLSETQFNISIKKAETQYISCANTCTAGDAACIQACEHTAYANLTTFNPAIAIMLGELLRTKSSSDAPCEFKTIGPVATPMFVCPSGMTLSALGITNSTNNASSVLENMKATNTAPLVRINLGNASSLLPTRETRYSDIDARKIRAYCFVTAQGIAGYWQSLSATYPTAPKYVQQFLIVGDPTTIGTANGMNDETYYQVYTQCKAGIEDALGEGVTVLYATPNDARAPLYLQRVLQKPQAVDALYTEPKIICDDAACTQAHHEELSRAQYDTIVQALAPTNRSITVLLDASLINDATNYGTRSMIDAKNAGVQVLFANRAKSFSVIVDDNTDEEITNATNYWSATMYGVRGLTYGFSSFVNSKPLPQGVAIFFTNASTNTVLTIHNYGSALTISQQDLNLSTCGVSATTITTSAGPQKTLGASSFNGTVPAHSVVTIDMSGGISCITPASGALAACSAVLDCNDTNPLVSPLVSEICNNGIDDNCNGRIDEQPCVPASTYTSPVQPIYCNYNGVCDEVIDASGNTHPETSATCRDCVVGDGTCPQVINKQTLSNVNVSLVADIGNVPYLRFSSKSTGCKFVPPIGTTPQGVVSYNTSAMPSKVIFQNGTSTVTLTTLSDRWKVDGTGTGLRACWGTTSISLQYAFADAPICQGVAQTCLRIGETCVDDTNCCSNNCGTAGTCSSPGACYCTDDCGNCLHSRTACIALENARLDPNYIPTC